MIEIALSQGAKKAAMISADQIVTSASFLDACSSNVCGNYGRCWMCPPDTGDIDVLIRKVKSFPKALLYQTIYGLEDSFDIEGMGESARLHAAVSRKIERAAKPLLPEGYLHLINGGCRYCETCAKQRNQPCVSPENALASLESHGIDVYNTTRSTDLKYINGQNTVTFFSMILLPEDGNV